MSLREDVDNLWVSIDGDIEHGECFYDKDMLNDFLKDLDKLKKIAIEYFEENQKELK